MPPKKPKTAKPKPKANGQLRQQFDADGRPAAVDRLTYAAISSGGKRQSPKYRVLSEDAHLTSRRRQILTATTRDAIRNFALASWMVRVHLDYTTAFTFQSRTQDSEFNDQLEALVRWKSAPQRCHTSRRHSLARLLRMAEARRVIDGDVALEKIAPPRPSRLRGTINTIEGDRIDHTGVKVARGDTWVNGVQLGRDGAARAYAIARRGEQGSGLEHEKIIRARNLYLHAYFDASHRFDQVRGISPLATALDSLRDVYEGINLAVMRLKVGQMFGMKIQKSEDADRYDGSDSGTGTDSAGKQEIDLNDGPFTLELDPGDDAEFLESKTPATETTQFLMMLVHVVMKSLDLPPSFEDASRTNFFGSRGALLHYLRSTNAKIRETQDLLNWITRWWLGLWIVDGDLTLPRGVEFDSLRWEWVPAGVPWWDPAKQVRGYGMAVGAHLDNLERVCRESGTDVYENIEINARVAAAALEAGVPIILPGVATAAGDQAQQMEEQSDGE